MELDTYSNSMIKTDMMNRKIKLSKHPKRIVCLVPSLTELLYDLGLDENVIGITKFCIKPTEWFRSKDRIGGTKNVNFEKIRNLNPDLIIGNKEENSKSDIEILEKDYNVWMSDINTYKEALIAIQEIANICNVSEKGKALISEIEIKRIEYSKTIEFNKKQSVLYFIWKSPYMVVGENTYINEMISLLGFKNCYAGVRYKELSIEEITELKPDYIFLSSEPYPFKEKHRETMQELFPKSEVKLVDGEVFSWYGSRLLHAFKAPF